MDSDVAQALRWRSSGPAQIFGLEGYFVHKRDSQGHSDMSRYDFFIDIAIHTGTYSSRSSRLLCEMASPRTICKVLDSALPVLGFIGRLISGVAHDEPAPNAFIQFLQNEILFEIFSFLELKPYVICHGVCKKWQQLLPSTQMHPTRRRLLDLYRSVVDTHDFEKTLEWTNQNLQPFDREEYVQCLLTQYPAIPEEFRMWILEWPARLAIQCTWPGLPFFDCKTAAPLVRKIGINWIAYRSFSPKLSSLVYKERTPSQMFIQGLFIWYYATQTDWLIFEQDEPNLFGRVIVVDRSYHNPGTIPYYPPDEDNNGDTDSDEDTDSESVYSDGVDYMATFADWISYLEHRWSMTAKEILRPTKNFLEEDRPIDQPVQYVSQGFGPFLPAPQWDFCERAIDR